MGISSYVDWPPENPLEEELIELECELKSCEQHIETLMSCRKQILEFTEHDTDLFLDEIQTQQKLKKKLNKQLFVFHLKNGQVF